MTRRVVFAGGIQAKALAKAYRHDVAYDRDDDVYFIGSESMAREAAHRVIAAADIVITDVTETGDTVPDHLIPPNAHRIGVPVIIGDFLWPFAGRPHPRNRGRLPCRKVLIRPASAMPSSTGCCRPGCRRTRRWRAIWRWMWPPRWIWTPCCGSG